MTEALATHASFREGNHTLVDALPALTPADLKALAALKEQAGHGAIAPTFSEWTSTPNTVLSCPACGGEEIHQTSVDIQWRKEDASTGLHISSNSNQEHYVSNEIDESLGYRRDAFVVTFWCEHCDTKSQLVIYQRKGATQMEWNKDALFSVLGD